MTVSTVWLYDCHWLVSTNCITVWLPVLTVSDWGDISVRIRLHGHIHNSWRREKTRYIYVHPTSPPLSVVNYLSLCRMFVTHPHHSRAQQKSGQHVGKNTQYRKCHVPYKRCWSLNVLKIGPDDWFSVRNGLGECWRLNKWVRTALCLRTDPCSSSAQPSAANTFLV